MSEYISRLQEAIASSIRGMSREDLLWRPVGKWSTAEVLEHLYLTYTGTVKGCERSLTAQDRLITSQTSKQRFKTLVVVTLGYFPPGLQAPAQVHPKGIPVEQVVSDIAQQITVMDELLTPLRAAPWKTREVVQSSCAGCADRNAMGQIPLDPWPASHATDSRVAEECRKSPRFVGGLIGRDVFYFTPALRSSSFESSSCFLALSTAFCWSAIFFLYSASSLSQAAEFRKRSPASA